MHYNVLQLPTYYNTLQRHYNHPFITIITMYYNCLPITIHYKGITITHSLQCITIAYLLQCITKTLQSPIHYNVLQLPTYYNALQRHYNHPFITMYYKPLPAIGNYVHYKDLGIMHRGLSTTTEGLLTKVRGTIAALE